MPYNKDFVRRIQVLNECLRNTYRKWTLQNLIDTVNENLAHFGKNASRRTIQADLTYMMNEKNAPIKRKREQGQTHYYYSDMNYSIENLPLEEEDVLLLKEFIRIVGQIHDFSFLEDVQTLIRKFENRLTTDENIAPIIVEMENHTRAGGTQFIEDLYTGAKSGVVLKITYQPFHKAVPEDFHFHPYLLKEFRNRWFVVGRREIEKTSITLALDRIKKIKPSGLAFLPNDLFDTAAYTKNLIGVSIPFGARVQRIVIKVSAQQTPYIKTKPIHFTQKILEELSDLSMIVELNLVNNVELRSVLLGYGCHLEVLEPYELRTQMMQMFVDGVNCYKKVFS